jgi:hypothetical protein
VSPWLRDGRLRAFRDQTRRDIDRRWHIVSIIHWQWLDWHWCAAVTLDGHTCRITSTDMLSHGPYSIRLEIVCAFAQQFASDCQRNRSRFAIGLGDVLLPRVSEVSEVSDFLSAFFARGF